MSSTLANEEVYWFDDPIYGRILFGPLHRMIIDTWEVQRLQGIKQLSTVYLVNRSANQTRFEHSIGVAYLGGQVIREFLINPPPALKRQEPTDRTVVEIGGLIHDVGHGPFGHGVTETILKWQQVPEPFHEFCTKEVIIGGYQDIDSKHYYDSPGIAEILDALYKETGFTPQEFAEMVVGNSPNPEKTYLAQLISSPIDMDRLDYLIRDLHYVGVRRGGVDVGSILHALTVVKVWGERPGIPESLELAIDLKAKTCAEALLMTRDLMYADVYHHPVNRSAQGMLSRAGNRLINDKVITVKEFVRMTDDGFLDALRQHDKYAQDIAKRIDNRRVFGRVEELEYTYNDLVNQGVWSQILRFIDIPRLVQEREKELTDDLRLEEGHVILDFPPSAKFLEAEARVAIDEGRYEKLKTVSRITRHIYETAYERRWKMMVFTSIPKEETNKRQRLVDKIKGLLNLKGSPSKY